MLELLDYKILDQLYESNNSIIYRGRSEKDDRPVVIKALKHDLPKSEDLTRFRREYVMTCNLKRIDGVIEVYSIENHNNSLAIVMEDFGGQSLAAHLRDEKLTLRQFLALAVRITDIIGQIHGQKIMHKDINPTNIVWAPQSDTVKVIDFGISTELPHERQAVLNPDVLEGTLAYMSPEQTGRMNRAIDYRTDLYSLGVTFYEMLTGRLPFKSRDAMEMIHCHIAKIPPAPDDAAREIPATLSAIIMKLMAKTAEERYQSALGVQADLQACLELLDQHGRIDAFEIGRNDFSDQFHIPEKLYGREAEIETLLNAFEQVSGGAADMLLVAGYSGVGKSSLIEEIHKPIVRQKGYFISGKFDQYLRNIPYASIIHAFRNLIEYLLTESDEKIQNWKKELMAVLGSSGRIIIDVIPELELIIGPQPQVPELTGVEAQRRFNDVFEKFLSVFCTKEHPLVLFLDDLQWADLASLKLIQTLMTGREENYLLILGAYRDNEVSASHPLMISLEEIRKKNSFTTITLSPLDLTTTNHLIADTLQDETELTLPLAGLIHEKTGGNPFFINQLITSLYEDRLLNFDVKTRKWLWNLDQIRELGVSDNVADLMAEKINKLPEKTKHLLQLASCLGNEFDLQTLSMISRNAPKKVVAELANAVREGLVVPLDDSYRYFQWAHGEEGTAGPELATYRFFHDRIHEAAYSQLAIDHRKEIHLMIGQGLLHKTPETDLDEKVFDIVQHLNNGVDLITSGEERAVLSRLNLKAGRKAMASAAYEPALQYLSTGLDLLAENGWETDYDLALNLHVKTTEAAYLCGEFSRMEQLTDIVLDKAVENLDKVKVYEIKIQALGAQNRQMDAINTALEILGLLDVHFPENPGDEHIGAGIAQAEADFITGCVIEDHINMPVMTNPTTQAALRIMNSIIPFAYQVAPPMLVLLSFKILELTKQHGKDPISALAFDVYGMILCGAVGDIESGYRFGQLGLAIIDEFDVKSLKPQIYYPVFHFLNHWQEPLEDTLEPLLETYRIALETGDYDFISLCLLQYNSHRLILGHNLKSVEEKMSVYGQTMEQISQLTSLNYNNILHQAALNLMGRNEEPHRLAGDKYDESVTLPQNIEANDQYAICNAYLYKMILGFLFEKYEEALEATETVEPYLPGMISDPGVPLYHFYGALIRLARCRLTDDPKEIEQQMEKVKELAGALEKWGASSPINYSHKYELVQAELLSAEGQTEAAAKLYDKAIENGIRHNYINDAALANELAAKFYLAREMDRFAGLYFNGAVDCYNQWGATAKVAQLFRQYPKYTQRAVPGAILATQGSISASSSESVSGQLDIHSILKAAQTLSGEVQLKRLLEKMLQILIENAGAQKGVVIENRNNTLLIQAEATAEKTTGVLRAEPVDASETVPQSVINLVARSKREIVSDNISKDPNYTNTDYIRRVQPKSVVCFPVMKQNDLFGIIYLENNLVEGAFTQNRLEVLNLLSSQIAISMENASLYANLEEKVQQRTAELRKAHEQILALEKEATEKQMAGGFAHEMRNALVGSKLVIEQALGYDTPEPHVSMTLKNSRRLKEIFMYLQERLPEMELDHVLAIMRKMFANEEHIDKILGVIYKSVTRGLSITQQIMDFARIGHETAGGEGIDPDRVIRDILEELDKDLQAGQINVELSLESGGIQIPGQESHLDSIFNNLILNARDALLDESLTDGRPLEIKISSKCDQASYRAEVSDNGVGISQENMSRIFDAFFSTKPETGTGLGLGVARKMVTLYGGNIDVESDPGQGTTFKVRLPLGA